MKIPSWLAIMNGFLHSKQKYSPIYQKVIYNKITYGSRVSNYMMSNRGSIAFSLSLAGGILIVLGGAVSTLWMPGMMTVCCQNMPGMMMPSMMFGTGVGIMTGFFILSAISGAIVLISALMLSRSNPKKSYFLGIMIIVFSAISIVGMGGFLIGAILGIIGGALVVAESEKVISSVQT